MDSAVRMNPHAIVERFDVPGDLALSVSAASTGLAVSSLVLQGFEETPCDGVVPIPGPLLRTRDFRGLSVRTPGDLYFQTFA
jgi:hypothetical protein